MYIYIYAVTRDGKKRLRSLLYVLTIFWEAHLFVTHDMRYLCLLLIVDFCIYIMFRFDARGVFQTVYGKQNFAEDPQDYASAPIYTFTAPVGMKTWRTASPVNRPTLKIAPSGIGFRPMNEPYTKQLIYDQEAFRAILDDNLHMNASFILMSCCCKAVLFVALLRMYESRDNVLSRLQISQTSTRQSISHITSFRRHSESLNDLRISRLACVRLFI